MDRTCHIHVHLLSLLNMSTASFPQGLAAAAGNGRRGRTAVQGKASLLIGPIHTAAQGLAARRWG